MTIHVSMAAFALFLSLCGSVHDARGAQNAVEKNNRQTVARPMRFVVPFTPGGAADIVARVIGPKLGEVLGRHVVIDNRPGGGSTLASDLVAKAAPDGSTILIANNAHAVNPSLYRKLPYDTERDFSPITFFAAGSLLLVVHPSVPATSVSDLIALAKSKPGRLNYSSPGNGSPTHLAAEMFKSMAGVDITHIPYKGAAPATADLLAGQVQMSFNAIIVAQQLVGAGKLRAIAVATTQRSKVLPEVPTIAEAGLPGYELLVWQGILAPGKTAKTTVRSLHNAIVAVLNMPEVKENLARQGYDNLMPSTPEEFANFLSREIKRWGKLVKSIGAQVD